jgi:hypothetical protein
MKHLFEFMDQNWLPAGLRFTLREILECGNSLPFRPYYEWVAGEIRRSAGEVGFTTVVELGAGSAPITRHLAKERERDGVRLVPCDLVPDSACYRALESAYPERVVPIYSPVDFCEQRRWDPDTLLVISGAVHHVPAPGRRRVIESLAESADAVMVFEPLRRTPMSALFCLLSLVPSFLLPLWFIGRPGRARRFLWCWLVPVAPLMFYWDGVVSCLRQWTKEEWSVGLVALAKTRRIEVHTHLFSYVVTISARSPSRRQTSASSSTQSAYGCGSSPQVGGDR